MTVDNKTLQKEIIPVKYFNMEKVTVSGFCDFCKKNIPLIIAVSAMLFFAYGIRLFWYSIGIDTESFMADKSGNLEWSASIGRFGYVLLSKFLYSKEFNPFTAFFIAFCLIWFFTISWCYIIAIFSRDTGRNNKLIPFALVLMTMPIWAEQFYFLMQAAENAIIISLCPYVIYLLYKGFLDNEKGKIVCAFILLVFMTSVYQAIVPMFCCGLFICFVLFQEHSNYESYIYRNLCLKLLILLIGAVAVYFIIDKAIIPAIFHIKNSDYMDSMNQWFQRSAGENIIRVFAFGYSITVGKIPFIANIVNPVVAQNMSEQLAMRMATISLVAGNVLLLPGAILFLIQLTVVARKTIPKNRRVLFIFAGVNIPISIMYLTAAGGAATPMRSLYVLPLALAFMLFYLIMHYKKKAAVVVSCLVLLTAVYQAQITAQLFYSDHIRYNEDVRFAYELDKLITRVQPVSEKLPVVLAGEYKAAPRFQSNFLQGEVIGHSFFEWDLHLPNNPTSRGLLFMKSLGIHFDMPDDRQLEQALTESVMMPPYPDPDCVKRMDDFIVVRISETLYW